MELPISFGQCYEGREGKKEKGREEKGRKGRGGNGMGGEGMRLLIENKLMEELATQERWSWTGCPCDRS